MQPDPQSLAVLGDFLANPARRYLLGATPYAAGIIATMPVQGVIDDFSIMAEFHGVPIIRTVDAPKDALVVTTTLGRPHTARQHLLKAGLAQFIALAAKVNFTATTVAKGDRQVFTNPAIERAPKGAKFLYRLGKAPTDAAVGFAKAWLAELP